MSATKGFAGAKRRASPRATRLFHAATVIAVVLTGLAMLAGPAAAADSISVSLVPSFRQCADANAAHAAPLSGDSCAPPARVSQILTVGTPDANGHSASSSGNARYSAVPGNLTTVEDEADVRIDVDVSDIRCAATNLVCPGGPGSDYTGKVIAASLIRITDSANGPNADQVGTATDVVIPAPIDCVATPDAGIGGHCTLNTSAEALLPGVVQEGAGTTWQFNTVQLWDAGPSGQGVGPACAPACSAEDGGSFMQQGIFIDRPGGGAGGDPTIAAAGDIACSPTDGSFNGGLGTSGTCRQLHTSNLLVDAGLAAVLPLGDVQYECGSSLPDLLGSFDLSWGRVMTLLRPVAGNHEYNCSATAAGFFEYFGLIAGEPGKGYYSFDIGNWHLIGLNSNCGVETAGCNATSPQVTWLKEDLAAHPNRCVLAYWHHPLFTSGESRRHRVGGPAVAGPVRRGRGRRALWSRSQLRALRTAGRRR